MVQLTYIIYYVQNVQKTIDFYQKAFNLKLNFMHESGTYAELATGEVSLAFANDSLGTSNLPEGYYRNNLRTLPAGCELVFITDNVATTIEKAIQA